MIMCGWKHAKTWIGFEAAGFDFSMAVIELKKVLQAMKVLSFQVAQLGLRRCCITCQRRATS
jgi:hypothetical protein